MRVLIAHNFYQHPGGEDVIFQAEGDLLERRGHEVIRFVKHNDDLADWSKVALAGRTVWNAATYRELSALIASARPDVAHFHNTLPVISPSAYHAAAKAGVAVVQTLHNYRAICPSATLFRGGKVCEDCVGKRLAWPGVAHACYRRSRGATGAIAAMLAVHHVIGTWRDKIDRYIALTDFARQRLVAGGYPAERIVVKPNFLSALPEHRRTDDGERAGALFVGRLRPEKGLDTMLAAWRDVATPLTVIGDGPELERIRGQAPPNVKLAGAKTPEEVAEAMRRAAFLLVPSEWYEGYPLVVLEAFAAGLPVIASRLGAMATMVEDGVTGLHFAASDAAGLARKVSWALDHPRDLRQMGDNARRKYESDYSPDGNYRRLIAIYEQAIAQRKAAA